MNELFGGFAGLPNPFYVESEEDYYRKYLVVGGPGYVETQEGDKALLWRELEKHIGSIDSELLRLIKEWYPTTRSVLTFLTSVGSYPNKVKIKALKEALTSPNRYSEENFMRITKILLGNARRKNRYEDVGPMRPLVKEFDTGIYFEDPIDPDAPEVDYTQVGAERKRRERWQYAWEDYLVDLEKRSGNPFRFEFLCDISVRRATNIMISPRLRLPSGEYLGPVTVTGTLLPVGPVVPLPISPPPTEIPVEPQPVAPVTETPVGGVAPVSEDKKDEKTEKKAFPWWIVIVAAVVVLFFMMKNK